MDIFTKEDTVNYKRWAILQKLKELKKKLKRTNDQQTLDRVNELQRDLDNK